MYLTHKNDRLKKLLQEELSCFKEILEQTWAFQLNLNERTTDALWDLLDEREIRINLIYRLENERKKLELKSTEYEPVVARIKEDIKDIALNLVQVDAEFLNILAMSKDNIVKELFQTTDNKNMMNSQREQTSRFIDIKQE